MSEIDYNVVQDVGRLKEYLDKGGDVNKRLDWEKKWKEWEVWTLFGEQPTLLHVAAYSGSIDSIRLLCSRGADITLRTLSGDKCTAYDVARYREILKSNAEILSLLNPESIKTGEYSTKSKPIQALTVNSNSSQDMVQQNMMQQNMMQQNMMMQHQMFMQQQQQNQDMNRMMVMSSMQQNRPGPVVIVNNNGNQKRCSEDTKFCLCCLSGGSLCLCLYGPFNCAD